MGGRGKGGNKRSRRQQSKPSPGKKRQCLQSSIKDYVVRPRHYTHALQGSNYVHVEDSDIDSVNAEDLDESSQPEIECESTQKVEMDNNMDDKSNSDSSQNAGIGELKDMMQQMMAKQDTLHSKVTDIEGKIGQLDVTLANQGKSLEYVHGEMKDVKEKFTHLEQEHHNLRQEFTQMQAVNNANQYKELAEQINRLERRSRERNIRLVGYREKPGENCFQLVEYILCEQIGVQARVEVAHRTGKSTFIDGIKRPRHIIFRVGSVAEKIQILQWQREMLQGECYFLMEDLTLQDLHTKRRLRPIIDQARQDGKMWKFRDGKLIINGQLYKENEHDQQQQQQPYSGMKMYTQPSHSYADTVSSVQNTNNLNSSLHANQPMNGFPPTANMRMQTPPPQTYTQPCTNATCPACHDITSCTTCAKSSLYASDRHTSDGYAVSTTTYSTAAFHPPCYSPVQSTS
jgi:archaellum component FlaC